MLAYHFTTGGQPQRFTVDTLSKSARSQLMARVKSKDTKPEMVVRKLVYRLGYRYRLNAKDLPGCPDLVFRKHRKVVFVHGCFWHRHKGCKKTRMPKSRVTFWQTKFEENRRRDRRNKRQLTLMGWKYLIVWECELFALDRVQRKVTAFMEGGT